MDREANRSTDRAAHPPQQGNEDNSSGTGYYTLKAVHSPHTDGESQISVWVEGDVRVWIESCEEN